MNMKEAIIAEIGEEEFERIGKWISAANESFKGKKLKQKEKTRQALLMLDNQEIKPKTLYVILCVLVLDDVLAFPIPEEPRWRHIGYNIEDEYSLEFEYTDGVAHFKYTDDPWNFRDAFEKRCRELQIEAADDPFFPR